MPTTTFSLAATRSCAVRSGSTTTASDAGGLAWDYEGLMATVGYEMRGGCDGSSSPAEWAATPMREAPNLTALARSA